MRVCVLETGVPPPEMAAIFPPYPVLFDALLRPGLPEMEMGAARALTGELPADVRDWDAYVITGSPHTAFDREPWMLTLEDFVRRAADAERKVLGICFGHQLAAQAFGGTVERRGWGLGVRRAQATAEGVWIGRSAYAAIVSHQDQVTVLPEGARVLAHSDFCPYEMLAIGPHVLTVQGHPEMTPAIGEMLVRRREPDLDPAVYRRYLDSLAVAPDNAEVGLILARFLRG